MNKYPEAIVIADTESSGISFVEEARTLGYKVIGYQSQPLEYFQNWPKRYIPPYVSNQSFFDHIHINQNFSEGAKELKNLPFDIKGVIAGSELGVTTADTLANLMNLRCNDPSLVLARRNKHEMKKAVERAGLRVAKHKSCRSLEELDSFIEHAGFPIVLKSPKGAGMYKMSFCHTINEAHAGFEKIVGKSDLLGSICSEAVAEEYITGDEYAIDIFANNGEIFVTDIWRYNRLDTSFCRNQYRDIFMEDIDNPSLEEAKEYAIAISKALGIRHGAAHPEIKIDSNGPVMMEVGSRLAGCEMPQMCRDLSNFDPITSTINSFCGEPINKVDKIKYSGYAWIAFCHTEKNGKIKGFRGIEEIQKLESYHNHFLLFEPGDDISPTVDLWNNPFIAWLKHKDREQVRKDAEFIHNAFDIITDD